MMRATVPFKATHGRIPYTGHWPEVLNRYFHIGPLARSVRDIAADSPPLESATALN